MPERPSPANMPGAPTPKRRSPPPVTNQPRPARSPTSERAERANSGLTPEQTIRHIALTHTTHYYRDAQVLPSADEVLKTAAQFAAWIRTGDN